jgi:hypothetical protein
MKAKLLVLAALGLVSLQCSGSTSGVGASSGASGSGGTSSGGSSGFPAGSTLSGTWDVVVSKGTSTPQTATLAISNSTFLFDANGFHLNLNVTNATPDVAYTYGTSNPYSGPLTVTRTPGALSMGALPLAVGGSWNFAGKTAERCTGEAHPESLSTSCTGIGAPFDILMPPGGGTGTSTAQRRSTLPSMFGDLGGSWNVVTPRAVCDVTFQDNLFSASCSQNNGQGTVDLTFTDGLASGKTSQGAELSAKRR